VTSVAKSLYFFSQIRNLSDPVIQAKHILEEM